MDLERHGRGEARYSMSEDSTPAAAQGIVFALTGEASMDVAEAPVPLDDAEPESSEER